MASIGPAWCGEMGIGEYPLGGGEGMWCTGPLGVCACCLVSNAGSILTWPASIRSMLVGSIDGFLLGVFEGFCIRNDPEPVPGPVGDVGAASFGAGEAACDVAPFCGALDLDVPQPHVCFRGIAAVTPAHPHCREGGCGHRLRGLPGFRTGTMRRSFAWLHFVERWPRIQGSL